MANEKEKLSTVPFASLDKPQADDKSEAKFDRSAVELDIPLDELNPEPVKVEDTTVIYVPMKSFGARVNKDAFEFRKGVQTRVSRDLANMLLEDESRGYIKD